MKGDPLTELEDLLESGRILVDPDVVGSYATAMRGSSGHAAFVVEPEDVSEVSVVAAWAHRHRRRLVVQGANTGLVGASTPDRTGGQGILGLKRLNGIIAVSAESTTVDVEAGVTLRSLNDHLASHGLFFPVEVGSDPTVGGMIATNAGGAHTVRYGTAGNRVIAVEGVLADPHGSIIGSLRRPRKDNSRLDVSRMMVGSYGSLGVIVRARLSLARLPQGRATAMIGLTGYEAVSKCLSFLKSALGEMLLAFELISGEAMQMTTTNVPGMPRPFGAENHICYVLVEVGSSIVTSSSLEQDLAQILVELDSKQLGVLADAVLGPPAEMWHLRHSLSEGVRGDGTTLRFDISMSPDDLSEFRARLATKLDTPDGPIISEFGHWADGGTHLQLVYPSDLAPREEEEARRLVYDLVVRDFAGSFSAEHGLGPFNAAFYERYIPESERQLERRLKVAFDPHGVWGVEPLAIN